MDFITEVSNAGVYSIVCNLVASLSVIDGHVMYTQVCLLSRIAFV